MQIRIGQLVHYRKLNRTTRVVRYGTGKITSVSVDNRLSVRDLASLDAVEYLSHDDVLPLPADRARVEVRDPHSGLTLSESDDRHSDRVSANLGLRSRCRCFEDPDAFASCSCR